MKHLLGLALAAAIATPAFAQSLALQGPDGQAVTLSAADVAAMPHVTVTATHHGKTSTFEGVPLDQIMTRVGAATGKAVHGSELATVVRVTAKDGYQVVFGLAETDPGTRADKIILADRADGAPLKADEGPFRIVAAGDLRPARSARMIEKIEVIRMATPKPSAAAHH